MNRENHSIPKKRSAQFKKSPFYSFKIAVISPPFIPLVSQKQRGTERIIQEIVEGLSKKGYKITLFGAGKYNGSANFVQIFEKTISEKKFNSSLAESSRALRIENVYLAKVMKEIIKKEREFDVIFNHARSGYIFLSLSSFLKTPIINVLHLPIFQELAEFLASYKKPNIITVSNSQRKSFSNINYLGTVYNGINLSEFQFCQKPKKYFLYLGTMGEHKNPKEAILAAKKANVKLILAGGKKRKPYFLEQIKPLIDGRKIKYLGEVSDKKRLQLLKQAQGLIFPIKWQEPFGLVMIEAMASGTPVIAYPNGAVREIIKDQKTGFVVKNINGIVKAIKNINKIDRKRCRQEVEKNFTVEKMVDNYEKIIKKII